MNRRPACARIRQGQPFDVNHRFGQSRPAKRVARVSRILVHRESIRALAQLRKLAPMGHRRAPSADSDS
jgi:hypothetical protein